MTYRQHSPRQYLILRDSTVVHDFLGSASEVSEYLLSMQRRFPDSIWDVDIPGLVESDETGADQSPPSRVSV